MPRLCIRLFGKFSIQCNGQIVDGLRASKAQELLCYLLLHRDHPHHRESLAGLLWADSSTAQSKKYLRQALWQIQSALGTTAQAEKDCPLLVDADWIRLNRTADLWLDVATFEQAFAHAAKEKELEAQHVQSLREAVELYQGDLLEGWYQDWCLFERERLQNEYLLMLDQLMGYCEVHQDYAAGLAYGDRILLVDRASERTHQRLMRLYYHAGDRVRALRQYEQCVDILREVLAVEPSETTVALYRTIRADHLAERASTLQDAHGDLGTNSRLKQLLGRLKYLAGGLAGLQQDVQREIQFLEASLANENKD